MDKEAQRHPEGRCPEVAGGLSGTLREVKKIRTYLFTAVECPVVRLRLRERSLVSESNTCLLKLYLQFHMDKIFPQYAIL